MNNVVLTGRIVRDVELRFMQNGKGMCKFTLAVQEDYKGKDGKYGVNFINVTAWGRTAEFIAEHCGDKGLRIGVEGSLKQSTWKDKEGKNRSEIYVNVAKVEPIDWAGSRQQAESSSNGYSEEKYSSDSSNFMDEDSPF